MKKNTFEVFHYRDTRSCVVEMHHHDFYEVYFFLGGKVEYRVEGRIYRLQPGDLILINPSELHQIIIDKTCGTYERIVLWINRDYLESFGHGDVRLSRCFDHSLSGFSNLLRPSPAQRGSLQSRLAELVQESYGDSDYAGELYAVGVFLQFMVELNRLVLQSSADTPDPEEPPALLSQVLDYIGSHYSEKLSLEGLAQQFYVSKYHLSHEFSRTVGVSVYQYILLKRLQSARQFLSRGMAPGEVCTRCGFGDYANFYRAFKSVYGTSPRACISENNTEDDTGWP